MYEWINMDPVAEKTLTLRQLYQMISDFGEGCEDGQWRFLQYCVKQTAGNYREWKDACEVRQEELRMEANRRVLVENANYYRDNNYNQCDNGFEMHEDHEDICALCGRWESDHAVEDDEVESEAPQMEPVRPPNYSQGCTCHVCRPYTEWLRSKEKVNG